MNKTAIRMLAIAICFGFVGLAFLTWLSRAPLKVPPRPQQIPVGSTWLGNEWVNCGSAAKPQTFVCNFFDDESGQLLQSGEFVLEASKSAQSGNLTLFSWDGESLQTSLGRLFPNGKQTHMPGHEDEWVSEQTKGAE